MAVPWTTLAQDNILLPLFSSGVSSTLWRDFRSGLSRLKGQNKKPFTMVFLHWALQFYHWYLTGSQVHSIPQLRCPGHESDTSLDKDWGIRLGSGSRQSRDLLVDGKKLVIRRPIKKNNTRSKAKNKKVVFKYLNHILFTHFDCILSNVVRQGDGQTDKQTDRETKNKPVIGCQGLVEMSSAFSE